jgi:hypothetical protein
LNQEDFDRDAVDDEGPLVWESLSDDLVQFPSPDQGIDQSEVLGRVEEIEVTVATRRAKAMEFFGPTAEDHRLDPLPVQERDDPSDELKIVPHHLADETTTALRVCILGCATDAE